MKSARIAPLLFLLLVSCAPGLDPVLDRAHISCESGSECPDGRVCVRELKRCLQRENPCIEPDGDGFRTVEAGRRCTAGGGEAGVCLHASCEPSRCGDGIVDRALAAPEQCDDGERNSDQVPGACRTDCALAHCGDGVLDEGEECDDGNAVDQDGCLSTCGRNDCGDGIVNLAEEQCDDGNGSSSDGCTVLCEEAACGDGFVQEGVEHCEDGNQNPNDGCDGCRTTAWKARLLAGQGEGGGRATEVALELPLRLATDSQGNLYVTDSGHSRVVKIDSATGRLTRIAGTGDSGYAGDGGPAAQAGLERPSDVAVDKMGNLFIADLDDTCIRRVDALTGRIDLVAGIPDAVGPPSGDGRSARHANIPAADSIAVDNRGNLFLNQRSYHTIRWIDAATGNIHRYAGTGEPGNAGDGGPATAAAITDPTGLAVDAAGNLFFGSGNSVRRVDAASRTISTVAVLSSSVEALDVRADGWLAVALTYEHQVLEISPSGTVTELAGTGVEGFQGDGGPAADAQLAGPLGLAWGAGGVLFVSDSYNHRVRRVGAGTQRPIDTVAGTGSPASGACILNDCTQLRDASGMAVDPSGRILLAESVGSVVRWVDPAQGTNGLVAGVLGVPGISTDGGQASQTQLFWPKGVAVDGDGNIFVSEGAAHRVRRIDAATGVISTVAGTGERGDSTGPTPALSLQLNDPTDVELDAQGNLYIADRGNRRVRRVDAVSGQASIVASGFTEPYGLAFDTQGRLLVADRAGHRIWRIGADGGLQALAGTGAQGFEGDGGAPELARLDSPTAVALAADGAILVADTENHRVRRISPDGGRITTLAGTDRWDGPSGDGGPASLARLTAPMGLAVDAEGGVLIADAALDYANLELLRRIDPHTGIITTVFGPVRPPGGGPLGTSQLGAPAALAAFEPQPGKRLLLTADGFTAVRSVDMAGEGWVSMEVGYQRGIEQAPAPAAYFRQLVTPRGIAVDPRDGSFYVSEAEGHTILKVSTAQQPWRLERHFGVFLEPGSGPARLDGPHGLLLDADHDTLFVAERDGHVVRALDLRTTPPTSRVVAGTPGEYGFRDADDAAAAQLNRPEALALAGDGSLYVADTGNHRVRRIEHPLEPGLTSVKTVTGLGLPGSGEGPAAALQPIDTPRGLAVDSHGNLFIAGGAMVWVVAAGADGKATGEDALRIVYGRLPRTELPESETVCLTGLLFAETPERPESSLYVLDACMGYLLALDRERM